MHTETIDYSEGVNNLKIKVSKFHYPALSGHEATESRLKAVVDISINDVLLNDDSLWKEAVASGKTTKGIKDWASEVIDADGRGHILNSWDGNEYEETVKGVTYYIYRG